MPGPRWRGARRAGGRSAWSRCRHRRLRGVRGGARRDHVPDPRRCLRRAALALLIQGLTAWHLTAPRRSCARRVRRRPRGGGRRRSLAQLGRPFGAGRVIATASSEDKRELALKLGADAAVDVTREDLADALREANDGRPVDVVFEMAGGRVFDASSTRSPRSAASSPTASPRARRTGRSHGALMVRKSRAVIGFWLMHCLRRARRSDRRAASTT